MARAEHLRIVVNADDKASPKLKAVDKNAQKVTKSFKNMKPALLAAGAAFAAVALVIVKKSLKAYAEQDLAVRKLDASLKNVGITSKEYRGVLLEQAAALQQVTAVGDETILGMQAMLVTFGLTGTELKKATIATMDLAAAQGVDLKAAALLVGKAFVGETGSLSRYGIIIDKNIESSEKFGAVLEALGAFQGQAEARAKSFTGQIEAMSGAIGDMMETLGANIAEGGEMSGFSKWIKETAEAMDRWMGGGTESSRLAADLAEIQKLIGISETTGYGQEFKGEMLGLKALNSHADRYRKGLSRIKKLERDTLKIIDAKALKTKQAAIAKEKEADALKLSVKLEKDRLKYIDKIAGKYDSINKSTKEKNEADAATLAEQQRTGRLGSIGALAAGDAAGLSESLAAALGASGPMGEMVSLSTSLLVNAKDLPKQMEGMITDLAEGIAEGLPILIRFLSTEFLPLMINGLATAVGGLVKGLPGMLKDVAVGALRTSAAVFTAGLSEVFGGWLFGGSSSPEEKLASVIKGLSDEIAHFGVTISSSIGDVMAAVSLGELDQVNRQLSQGSMNFSTTMGNYLRAGLAGDHEQSAALLQEMTKIILSQIQLVKTRYDIEKKGIEEAIRATETLRDSYMALKDSALSAIQSAIANVSGALRSPGQNVAQLQAAFMAAGNPEEKSAAAAALAGGLQGQFSAAQNLASQGAISGEELQRIQQDVLGQLRVAEEKTKTEFDLLIEAQNKQIEVLQVGFDALQAELRMQLDVLEKMYNKAAGGGVPEWVDFGRGYNENRNNIRGTVQGG